MTDIFCKLRRGTSQFLTMLVLANGGDSLRIHAQDC